jgi:hypothetical protein
MSQMITATPPASPHKMDLVTGVLVIVATSLGSVLLVNYLFFF